jgi:hypothetical protein
MTHMTLGRVNKRGNIIFLNLNLNARFKYKFLNARFICIETGKKVS